MSETTAGAPLARPESETAFAVIGALAFCHLVNDMMQALMMAIYPLLKASYALDFAQIGLLTLAYQVTASLLQPLIGLATDRRPQPYVLAIGMGFTVAGVLLLAFAGSFAFLLAASTLVGIGSAIFHPDASRMARHASGGRHGLAQSLFQVGGNVGHALGPLAAAMVVLGRGQESVAWFVPAGLVAAVVLWQVAGWSRRREARLGTGRGRVAGTAALSPARVTFALAILCLLVFSKFVYMASLSSYFTFYLMETFGIAVTDAQMQLFLFSAAVAFGTLVGGPIGDRIGRRRVIWISILGILPFTLALPHVGLAATSVLVVLIGVVLASAFPAIVVYAQELLPGRVGMVAGLFFGLAFGIGGIGAAVLGEVADADGIAVVYRICSVLPAIGLLAVFLPDVEGRA